MDNQLMNTSAIETIDSREVAEMVDMRHDNLLKIEFSGFLYS